MGCPSVEVRNQQLIVFDLSGRQVFTTMIIGRILKTDLPGCESNQVLAYRILRNNMTVVASGKFLH